jgi:hypothetical protein
VVRHHTAANDPRRVSSFVRLFVCLLLNVPLWAPCRCANLSSFCSRNINRRAVLISGIPAKVAQDTHRHVFWRTSGTDITSSVLSDTSRETRSIRRRTELHPTSALLCRVIPFPVFVSSILVAPLFFSFYLTSFLWLCCSFSPNISLLTFLS